MTSAKCKLQSNSTENDPAPKSIYGSESKQAIS
uniref:Uncharacterized protein n=1 Tax=Moniliophthora roreri TaxID=221103 RepID=A0A0W0GCM7_MONRR